MYLIERMHFVPMTESDGKQNAKYSTGNVGNILS